MNRIYQGKVTAVEIPGGKDEHGKWKKLDAGESALWQHHELFQDAVNYYTLALAALAGGLKRDDPKARENEIKVLDDKLASLVELAKKAKKSKDEAAMADVAKQKQKAETDKDRLQREESIWQWREQVGMAFEEGVERKGRQIQWEKKTLARLLKKLDPGFDAINKFDASCETILKSSKATPQLRVNALMRLLALAAKKKGDAGAALTPLCTDKIVWLCSRPEKLDATDDVAKSVAEKAAWEFANILKDTKDAELEDFAAKLKPAVFMPRERGEILKGKDAIMTLLSYFKQLPLQKNSPELKAARFAVAQRIRKIRASKKNNGASPPFTFQLPKSRVGLDYKAAKVFKEVPHPVLAAVFRKETETRTKKKTVEVLDCDPLKDARTEANQPQFDYFSNLAFIAPAKTERKPTKKRKVVIEEDDDDDSDENRANWIEFDLVAFVEALKSPHRYLQDTVKRKDECDSLEKRLNALKGAGEEGSNEGEDDTTERLQGFKGDYRIGLPGDAHPDNKGVYQLIRDKTLLAYREDDDGDGEEEIYGLNENTLRGWNELRRKWREAAAKEDFKGETKMKDLLDELDRIRRDGLGGRPEEAGSGPLFKRLQSPEYHCIWKDQPPDSDLHWEDPLWGWVKYHEFEDELEKTKRPIRFTPAHATESPRRFGFPKQMGRNKAKAPVRGKAISSLKTDHLPGMFVFNDEDKLVEVMGDEAWLKDRRRFMAIYTGLILGEHPNLQPTPVRIIFSAPRLRRDHIRSDKESGLGSISLLQPMLEALGIASEHLPEINFANCPMTLLAERRKRPNELAEDESDEDQKITDRYDINLSFPVTLEEENLQKHEFFRHKQSDRWNYQKSGDKGYCFAQFNYSAEEPRYEISLQWPSDIKHSKEAVKADAKRKERKHKADWFERMDKFSCLSLDLGQREGGAYAVLDVFANADFGKNKHGKPIPSRFIGQTGEKKWRAALALSGMLRLPGEDAKVFVRPRKPSGKNGQTSERPKGVFQEEPWGDRGRPALRQSDPSALCDETEDARRLLDKDGFDQLDIMATGWNDPNSPMFISFPEQNDKLIVASRRYFSRIRRLHRWCAFFNPENWPNKADKVAQKRQRALQEIREACGLDEQGAVKLDDKSNAPLDGEAWLAPLVKPFVASGADDSGLVETLKTLLEPMLKKLPSQLEDLANRCVPLRPFRDHRDGPLYGSWRWTEHHKSTSENRLHILLSTGEPKPNAKMLMPDGKEQKVTWIRGQRGLSMKRIAQLEDLRRLLQSLNQIQRRKIGTMPTRRKRGEKGDELPDCCPRLLEKLEALKEQRVNQMAHHVLALALGLRLKKSGPTKSEAEREHSDIHGEYERIPDLSQRFVPTEEPFLPVYRRPVDFIVIEDLKYYETTRVRSRRENVRLMRWCRRHFRDKLKQLCDVFGFPVIEANPANTSKFCARTGIAGFRAVEVVPGFHEEYVWRKALEKLDQSRRDKKKLEPDDLAFCEGAEQLKQQVEDAQKIPTKSGKALPCPRTLLAPLGSGNVFVPIADEVNNADLPPAVVQADVNAAVMLAFRAITDPRLWEFHPRLRTRPPKKEKKSKAAKKRESEVLQKNPDGKPNLPDLFVAEKRKFGEAEIPLDLTKAPTAGVIKDSRKPNYFRDLAGMADLLNELSNLDDSQAAGSLGFAKMLVAKDKVSIPEPQSPQTRTDLLSGKAFWLAVKKLQWQRCLTINAKRIAAWKEKLNPMPD